MSYNLEEQDQIEQLRDFWQRWGTAVSAVLLLVALAWAGWSGWNWWQRRESAQASNLYSQLSQRIAASDLKDATPIFQRLRDDYASTAYAQMGALTVARAYADAGQAQQAQSVLRWAAGHGPIAAQRAAAMLDLAAMQIDAHQFDAALQTLRKPPASSFSALFLTGRGDVYAAQGEREQARKAYTKALAELPADAALRQLLQIKLDSVGGAA